MINFRQNLWGEGEYNYKASYGFMPNIRSYIHDDGKVRDCMLVVPGGGYCMVVPSEGEIVAREFYKRGMNAFVLTYTTDITMSVPLKRQPLNDIARAVRIIRKKHNEYNINPDRIIICGFSAGGHVCGSLCVHFDDCDDDSLEYGNISCRPDGAILSYPVLTTGEYTHIYSVEALLGKNPSEDELKYYSIEKNVTADTPPCFLWSTEEDGFVPAENTYLMAKSLRENHVHFAHYVFPKGHHGLSVATDDYYRGEFGQPYTYEQLDAALIHVRNNTAVDLSDARREELIEQFSQEQDNTNTIPDDFVNPYTDVMSWPDLAMNWMKTI